MSEAGCVYVVQLKGGNMKIQWMVRVEGSEFGPISTLDLKAVLASRKFRVDTIEVRAKGMRHYVPVTQLMAVPDRDIEVGTLTGTIEFQEFHDHL